jgi:hypothetical protein
MAEVWQIGHRLSPSVRWSEFCPRWRSRRPVLAAADGRSSIAAPKLAQGGAKRERTTLDQRR